MEKVKEHILVCLSSAPSNPRIIRTAATMAQAFESSFTALFVQTPAYEEMSDADKERLRANTYLAESLGATVETVFGDDVSYQIAEYARLSGVTKIVIGRSAVTRKHPWNKPTLTEKLTVIAPNLDIHIIPDASVDGSYRPQMAKRKVPLKTMLWDWAVALGILTLATLVGFAFSEVGFTQANIIAIFLLAVLLTSMATSTRSSYVLSAIGSVLVFNFFFTTPQFSLRVYEHGAPMTFLVMIVAALSVGTMTDRLKSQVRQSAQAAYRTNLLFETNQMLQQASTDDAVFQTARIQLQKLLNRDVAVYPGIVSNGKQDTICCPLRINEQTYGTVVIQGRDSLEAFENSVLLSILGEGALARENSQHAREKEEAKLLAENEKLRANLLRSISHDLRTPLTAISGNAAILLSDEGSIDASQKRQIYTDIYDDAAWLANLVENLLAVTRIEEGRMKLQMQPQLVEEIVSESLNHISRKKAAYHICVHHEDELLFAQCDARLIVQVLINLIDNAIKYTPEGSSIRITTKASGGKAVICVADDGPGIPDGEKSRVFQMFYTGSNPIGDSRRSLGLGLGLCRAIVTAHGGEITVRDNQPHGTVFTFTLPSGEVQLHE